MQIYAFETGVRLLIVNMKNNGENSKDRKWPGGNEVFPRSMTNAIIPVGNGGFTPCPELLTEQEAISYLRLDMIDIEDPASTLRYYRKKGLLQGTQVGKCVRFRRIELEKLLDRLTEINPR
jgi:hypothetical protein